MGAAPTGPIDGSRSPGLGLLPPAPTRYSDDIMHRFVLIVIFCMALAAPAWAGFDEGVAAYERGDYETALQEFRPLAEQGLADAQTALGWMYYLGRGVLQDYVRAHMWYNLAAAQGDNAAAKNREIVAAKMTPADISKAQGMAREWLAKHGKAD